MSRSCRFAKSWGGHTAPPPMVWVPLQSLDCRAQHSIPQPIKNVVTFLNLGNVGIFVNLGNFGIFGNLGNVGNVCNVNKISKIPKAPNKNKNFQNFKNLQNLQRFEQFPKFTRFSRFPRFPRLPNRAMYPRGWAGLVGACPLTVQILICIDSRKELSHFSISDLSF